MGFPENWERNGRIRKYAKFDYNIEMEAMM